MSWVANMMIAVAMPDVGLLPGLSDWLANEAPRRPDMGAPSPYVGVGRITDQTSPEVTRWGGGKHPECEVWAGALNHADLDALRAKIASMPWKHPGAVQLLLMDQEQSYFRLFMIRDGGMVNFSPEPPEDVDWVY